MSVGAFAVVLARRAAAEGCASAAFGAWYFVLSRDLHGHSVLTAQLLDGCSSVVDDWATLGRVVAALNGPAGLPNSVLSDPSGTHRWEW